MKTEIIAMATMMALMGIAGLVTALDPLDDSDALLDPDQDGLTNLSEFLHGSDPNCWDTDGDGLPDGWEVETGMDPTDPSDAYMDNDYFLGEEYAAYSVVDPPYDNYAEYYRISYVDQETGENVYVHTDPNDPDSDGDNKLDPDDQYPMNYRNDGPIGYNTGKNPGDDGEPIPVDPTDTDGDGIPDVVEYYYGTDPYNPDTDGDGLSDLGEVQRNLDPNDWDTDNDMLIDSVESGNSDSTDGHGKDTDNDGTDPSNGGPNQNNPNPDPIPPDLKDSDGDGVPDVDEFIHGTDYLNPDTDGDGASDYKELLIGTDPNDWDTDNDLLIDGVEEGNTGSTDGHLDDTDNDGLE